MIGDTIQVFQDATTPWATLPGQSSNAVTLQKVNQDNYGAEYRYAVSGGGRYILRVRNNVEPASALKSAVNRHNVELTYISAPDAAGVERSYIAYVICRFPPDGSQDVMEAIFYALTRSITEAQFGKIRNFES